jgi:hypothetical protein
MAVTFSSPTAEHLRCVRRGVRFRLRVVATGVLCGGGGTVRSITGVTRGAGWKDFGALSGREVRIWVLSL